MGQALRAVSALGESGRHFFAAATNVDPRRVDIYQLGTLLCRLLTGQSVNDFLSRPRVAAKVSPKARELIERGLGHDSQRAIRSAEELLRALEMLDASATQALPNALPGSTETSPSRTRLRVSSAWEKRIPMLDGPHYCRRMKLRCRFRS